MSSHDGESLEKAEAEPATSFAGPGADADGSPVQSSPPEASTESPTGEAPADESLPAPPIPAPKRRRRWKVLTVIGVLLVAALLVSSFVTIPYYALTPGSAQSVLPLIGLPASLAHDHGGSVDLVDVEVTPLRLIDWLYFKLDSNATIYSSAQIQGPETSAQYNTEGVLDMADAQQAATVVALTQLGYHVKVTPNGSLVYALDPGSPADAALQVGDVIVGVAATTVSSPASLSAALASYKPGQATVITYRPYPKGASKQTTIHMGVWRLQGKGANQQLACVPADAKSSWPIAPLVNVKGALYLGSKQHPGHATACIGVLDAEPSYAIGKLPFRVNLNSEGIVGPSAGLAFTLGLMQKLDPANLTGGHQVAATGTMSVTGQVGAIGGIQQKTIAVRAAGASIFLVPPANYPIAKKYAGSTLKVFAVSSISQALHVLARYGGKVSKPTGS